MWYYAAHISIACKTVLEIFIPVLFVQEVRRTLFKLEPGNKANWLALAVAMHLDKDYESVLSMLQAFENATAATPLDRYQRSEFLIFKVAFL